MEPKLTAHQREILQNAVEHDGTNSARFRLQDLNHLDGLGFLEPYDSYQRATSDRMIVKFVITPSGRAALTESAPATEPTRDDLIAALGDVLRIAVNCCEEVQMKMSDLNALAKAQMLLACFREEK